VFQDTIATVICATALTLCALGATAAAGQAPPAGTAPAPEVVAPPQLPVAEDPLIAPRGTCIADANPAAHHRNQRLAMHCLLAHLRRRAGLPPLRSNASLRHSATYKARRVAACKVFTHNPCGDALGVPFQQALLTRRGRWTVGENLAWGVDAGATARAILDKWLRSPTHRRVLLTRSFGHLGVRRRRLAMEGAPPGAVLWVAHLGRPARR
jgi:uncharacterized protein YkwD